MNNEEFLNEMLEYCTIKYRKFERVQRITLELLKVFTNICYLNNIPCYAVYGTLLGIKRDKGMIPWDYDADVAIPYCYIDQVHQCLSKSLPDEYYFVSDRTDDTFSYYQMRICKKGYSDNIHLDVFYLFGLSENVRKQFKLMKRMKRLFKLRKIKIESKAHLVSSRRKWALFAKKIVSVFLHLRQLNLSMKKICSKCSYEKSSFVSFVYHEDFVFEKRLFGIPQENRALGFRVLVPEKSEEYLSDYYGDWQKYYSLKTRCKEYEQLFCSLEKTDNLDSIDDKTIAD